MILLVGNKFYMYADRCSNQYYIDLVNLDVDHFNFMMLHLHPGQRFEAMELEKHTEGISYGN